MKVRELFEIASISWVSKSDDILKRDWNMLDPPKNYQHKKTIGSIGDLKVILYYNATKNKHDAMAYIFDGKNVVGSVLLRPYGKWDENTKRAASYETHTVHISEPYRGKGLAKKLYKLLIDNGFILVSGEEQSPGGKSIWKELRKDKEVKVQGFNKDDQYSHRKQDRFSSANKARSIYDKNKANRLVAFK